MNRNTGRGIDEETSDDDESEPSIDAETGRPKPKKERKTLMTRTRSRRRSFEKSKDSFRVKGSMMTMDKVDPYTKRPSKWVKNAFGSDFYSSYWLKCIEAILPLDFFAEQEDIGYYSLFYMDKAEFKNVSSYKLGGEHRIHEQGWDFQQQEEIYKAMFTLNRKVEYD